MLEPKDLYQIVADVPDLDAPVLVHGMGGFIDAGSAVRLAGQHLLSTLDADLVARFDVDLLLDYRSRRPVMIFDRDHWKSYAEPSLALYRLRDALGTSFLYLDGPEPDLYWDRFVAAMQEVIERFGVRLTIGLNAIPMAVPHTRPTAMTAHATRPELVAEREAWVTTVQVPGSAGALLELRLGAAGHDAAGFAVHVPHYLAQTEYPAGARALLDAVSEIGGLDLPTDALGVAAEQSRNEIDAQVAGSEEVAAVVHALEEQYDSYVEGQRRPSLLADEGGKLPSADELGAEFERFLAEQPPGGAEN